MTCCHLVVSLACGCLTGKRLVLGRRRLTLSAGFFLPGVDSHTNAAVDVFHRLLLKALTLDTSSAQSRLSSTACLDNLLELEQQDGVQGSRLSLSVDGPFRMIATGAKWHASLDGYVHSLRASPGDGTWHLWTVSPVDFASCARGDSTGGFAASTMVIPLEYAATGGIPTPPDAAQNSKLAELVSTCFRVGKAAMAVTFDPSAVRTIEAVARKSVQCLDVLRHLSAISAALHFIHHGPRAAGRKIDASTAGHAAALWQEAKSQQASILNPKEGRGSGIEPDFKGALEKGHQVVAYAMRKGLRHMSPRDVVLHGLADHVGEAKLLFALLETLGCAEQMLFVQHGRALQKWRLDLQRTASTGNDGRRDASSGPI